MIVPWSYRFTNGTFGCVMAGSKATAILTIVELNPTQLVDCLTLHKTPEWTSNPHCDSPVVNTYQTQRS